ncbi:MAG: aminodeoxychorismate/anthranilate synthase component II [Bacteroidota bacterium]|nr:aminodeoxychorismate/anthranilate synthase component II [Bacteroidota bacterium]
MRVLILDNYDSFTHNLYHYAEQFAHNIDVIKNDRIRLDEVSQYDKIILSPGPGLPDEHINLKSIINALHSSKSILGVCLGHQAIAECFGAKLRNLEEVMHGVSTKVLLSNDELIYKNLPKKIKVGHYHSWVVDNKSLPVCFEITSKNEDDIIMSIRHKEFDLIGLQFHPESIMTEYGLQMIKNWIQS